MVNKSETDAWKWIYMSYISYVLVTRLAVFNTIIVLPRTG